MACGRQLAANPTRPLAAIRLEPRPLPSFAHPKRRVPLVVRDLLAAPGRGVGARLGQRTRELDEELAALVHKQAVHHPMGGWIGGAQRAGLRRRRPGMSGGNAEPRPARLDGRPTHGPLGRAGPGWCPPVNSPGRQLLEKDLMAVPLQARKHRLQRWLPIERVPLQRAQQLRAPRRVGRGGGAAAARRARPGVRSCRGICRGSGAGGWCCRAPQLPHQLVQLRQQLLRAFA